LDLSEFDLRMELQGWAQFDRVVPLPLVRSMKQDIRRKEKECEEYQRQKGLHYDGTAHHVIGDGNSIDKFLANSYLKNYIEHYFDGRPYILHTINAVTIKRGQDSYVNSVHRDAKTYSGRFRFLLNMLVMLDDFTIQNGATYILPGSHQSDVKPSEDNFFKESSRLVGKTGTIILFNSLVWHAAGKNKTPKSRTALTVVFSRPFVKQRLDYPRFLSVSYASTLSPEMRQILGFNAIVPANYDEWYRPPENRFYKGDQW